MRLLLFAFCLTILAHESLCYMSEQQFKAAIKLIRNVCQPKSKVTDEEIDAMHKGNWDLEKPAQCYNYCILNMYKLIKKDGSEYVFDHEAGIKTIKDQLDPKIGTPAAAAVSKCKDAVKTPTDKCAAGHEINRCIYEADPEKYFLP